MRSTMLLAASAVTLTMAAPALAVDVYDQLPFAHGGLASDGAAGQYYGQRIADDFVLTSAADVNGVTWVGASEGYIFTDLTNFSDFSIAIYSDILGVPGTPLVSMTVPVATTSKTALGTDLVTGGELFEFSVTFGPVSMGPGTYHFSVGTVNVDPMGDGWVWNNAASPVNDLVAAETPVGGGFGGPYTGYGDMAFSIQAVPGPGGLLLLGIAGLAGRVRRRRA